MLPFQHTSVPIPNKEFGHIKVIGVLSAHSLPRPVLMHSGIRRQHPVVRGLSTITFLRQNAEFDAQNAEFDPLCQVVDPEPAFAREMEM